MKIAHIADIHLGYTSGKKVHPESKHNLRELDGYNALNEAIDQMIEDDVDCVVCTGDFFHSPTPSMRTIAEAQKALTKLSEKRIPFYCLAGNHDSTDVVKDTPSSKILHCPQIGLYSVSEPYVQLALENSNIVLHMISHHQYSTRQKQTMEEIKPIKGAINILCTHGSCYDEAFGGLLHTEGEPREIILPEKVLSMGWDYIWLGHIHERGWVGSTDKQTDTANRKIFYAGSLFRRGFSDKESKLGRGWTAWEIDEETKEFIPKFYSVTQRLQTELNIDCTNKTVTEIELEIENWFKSIDLEQQPILRVCLLNISNTIKTQINWDQFEIYTSKCLSFGVKVTTTQEVKLSVNNIDFSFDLAQAYASYLEEIISAGRLNQYSDREIEFLSNISKKLLKQSQDMQLEKEA